MAQISSTGKKILVISFQSLIKDSAAGMGRVGFEVSKILHQHGLLQYFVVSSKGKYTTSFPSKPVSFFSRYYLFLLNTLNKYLKFKPYKFRFWHEVLFDFFCQAHVTEETGLIVATNGFLKRTLAKAKKKGIKVIYIPGNPENNYISDIVQQEQALRNLRKTDVYTYQPRLAYYNATMQYVDEVISIFETVYTSYKQRGFPNKIVKVHGFIKPMLPDVETSYKTQTPIRRIGYIAYTVLLKGLPHLLEAWSILQRKGYTNSLELYIAGDIEPSLNEYIQVNYAHLNNIVYLGKTSDVPGFMRQIDVLVVPSLIDGGPNTSLEAAHYAVPTIFSENCGYAALMNANPNSCWIVPIMDAASIATQIIWCIEHPEETYETGRNAQHALKQYNTHTFYEGIASYIINQTNGNS